MDARCFFYFRGLAAAAATIFVWILPFFVTEDLCLESESD
jgi:hypothetical protein